jgi:transposase
MPAYFFRSEPGAAELRRLARRESGRVCQRVLMIANLLEGMEHEAAARLAGLSRSAAYEWHNRYEEEGIEGLRASAEGGSPPLANL